MGRWMSDHEFEEWRNQNAKAIAVHYERRRRWFYGTVTVVRPWGFKIAGEPNAWLRFCRHAQPALALPEVGKKYVIVVDGGGRVHELQPVEESTGEDIPFDIEPVR